MDYYQGVVVDYLRADRAIFVNPECCIQLNDSASGNGSGPHWYCDVLAIDLRTPAVYLCEVSYSKTLGTLFKRLEQWNTHWPQLLVSLARDSNVPDNWPVRPWLFVPSELVPRALDGVQRIGTAHGQTRQLPVPKITTLEAVAPWKYPENRIADV